MVPERFHSSFSTSTLKTLEAQAARLSVTDPLFFRGAYTATVTENERRSFSPVVVMDASSIAKWRCTCVGWQRPDDLCRHIGLLVAQTAGEGSLPAEKFESSVWRAIAFAAFTEGRALELVGQPDPRETLLRKYALTEQEQKLIARGAGSTRLQWEASPWYRWAKEMFLRYGDGAAVRLERREESFWLCGREDAGPVELRDPAKSEAPLEVPLPEAAVEAVVTANGAAIALASGFELARESVTPSLRIEITRDRALKFVPVLIGSGGAIPQHIHERRYLRQYGRLFLIGNRFVSPAPAMPMFVERSARDQASLFEVRASAGLPYDRETLIAEEEVFAFVERHREELARMPESLAPEAVRHAQPVKLEGEVLFDFAAASHRDLLEVDIRFRVDADDVVTAAEIAKARKDGVRALIRGNVWIDVTDGQFAWLDAASIGKNGHVLVTKLELLRIRGSLRGQAVFAGDQKYESVFRMFDELQLGVDAPSPADLGFDLYAYQQTGYRWLWLLQQNGFGGLLCDDMGLGKTHQAMALMAGMLSADPSLSVLVVCPTSLIDHWREKLTRYAPDVPFEVIHGARSGSAGSSASVPPEEPPLAARVTVTTYGTVRSKIEFFRGRRFDLMVLDEAQTIKNADTATHHALRAIEKRIAVGLTGTPVENHEGELKALLDFVVPGYLPKYVDDRMLLQRLVRPFVLRRTKAQVLPQLPPKIVDKRYCEMGHEQRALYREVIEGRARPLRALLRSGAHVSYVHVFAALNFLKQICNHPASAGGGFASDAPSAKWEMFTGLLDECLQSGLKVVVFSQYVKMLELMEDHLSRAEIGYASIKGATRDRGAETARFRDDPDCRVFTASLRAGGLGIDLTSASVVIHYDRWWNQAREDQATDRVHRLGQNKGVQVIKLITRGTIEEKIDALIERKALMANELIQTDDPALVKQFSVEELEELLSE
ncbi:MAG TPA: DEAD/DEAH box helicase [Thermoanaerobaculia bacterium]|jgi:superfamily II DNA or RNA helicase